jgi:predicted DNA-binding helix-hairpin-helix protein
LIAPPLVREHRLYQADWLMRFYGFKANEITNDSAPNLDLRVDPKLAWALRNRQWFPVNLNRAPRHLLLRVPGLGVKNVDRILQARRWSSVCLQDLVRLHVPLKKALPFIEVADHHPQRELDSAALLARLGPPPEQMDLFSAPEASVLSGQL